ncbi:TolC family protein [Chitinophaga pinensis]|uniref:Outer membrane protein n=1 Tax=Chitinophaga pinensis (strain ATCC 43595 / DSM 2588 / LMG 13176 / NBRC 15968 / NCIMB 11800 / UQM 2034) TaxID=485918 RepID=A0A979GBH7_CHIPD|nr:TolC family protein [Chitinophaga pinensis]ACU64479.1 putative outer membrane protein [Chitinophaga pinensis DSM 2588]
MIKKPILFTICGLLTFSVTCAQQTLSLQGVVVQAQQQSPSYYKARSSALNSLYAFRYYVAGRRPQLKLQASNNSSFLGNIESIRQPDGTYAFSKSSYSYTFTSLAADQIVPFTGGQFSVATNLSRNDVFDPSSSVGYLSTPFSISYFQPTLLYNPYRWDSRIQPLLYEESKKQYIETLERTGLQAAGYFFDALVAQQQELILQQNVANTDTLYKISKGRYELGKIAENELLQIELNLINARNNLEQASLSKEIAYRELTQFLTLPKGTSVQVALPDTIPTLMIPVDIAQREAQDNRQAVLAFRRQRLEAEQQVAEARGNSGYQLNLSANFGQARQGASLKNAYGGGNLQQTQLLSVGVSIPIMDWGRARNRVRQAKANQELIEIDIQQQERNFEQEIYLQTQQFNIQRKLLESAAKADTIAKQRYEITKQRYYIGKISITDLNLAQQEKDMANQNYINALRSFWTSYYTVRLLTLYDFEKAQKIRYEFKER